MKVVNLSRRPFVNARPLKRLAVLLWLVGTALAVYNLFLYGRYFTGSTSARDRLTQASQGLEQEREQLDKVEDQVKGLRLQAQNRQVIYLNNLMTLRTFPWSELFDRLEEVLPREVRLVNVRPSLDLGAPEKTAQQLRQRRRRGNEAQRPAKANNRVRLTFNGVAQSEDAMFTLVNNLFASQYFGRPALPREALDQQGQVTFNMTVDYKPTLRIEDPAKEVVISMPDLLLAEGGRSGDATQGDPAVPNPLGEGAESEGSDGVSGNEAGAESRSAEATDSGATLQMADDGQGREEVTGAGRSQGSAEDPEGLDARLTDEDDEDGTRVRTGGRQQSAAGERLATGGRGTAGRSGSADPGSGASGSAVPSEGRNPRADRGQPVQGGPIVGTVLGTQPAAPSTVANGNPATGNTAPSNPAPGNTAPDGTAANPAPGQPLQPAQDQPSQPPPGEQPPSPSDRPTRAASSTPQVGGGGG